MRVVTIVERTKRLSADGSLSAVANRRSLTFSWAGVTPFTLAASEGPDLKTSSLDGSFYARRKVRTVPAKTAIELSLGDTDVERLCPALTNSSLLPLEKNGGKRSR